MFPTADTRDASVITRSAATAEMATVFSMRHRIGPFLTVTRWTNSIPSENRPDLLDNYLRRKSCTIWTTQ